MQPFENQISPLPIRNYGAITPKGSNEVEDYQPELDNDTVIDRTDNIYASIDRHCFRSVNTNRKIDLIKGSVTLLVSTGIFIACDYYDAPANICIATGLLLAIGAYFLGQSAGRSEVFLYMDKKST